MKIYPTATVSGSSITVNGNELAADGSATVTISGETTVMIAVSSGNYTTTYTLTIQPGQGKKVTFKTASDVTLTVVNKNGEELAYTKTVGTGGTINYLYTLVPGDDYSYVATQGTYYHAKKSFTLGSSEVIQVSVKQEDWLEVLDLGDLTDKDARGNLKMNTAFDKQTHEYTLDMPDAVMAGCFVQIDLRVSRLELEPHSSRRSLLHRDRIFCFGFRRELVRHCDADGFLLLRSVQLQRNIFQRGKRRAVQRDFVSRRIVAIAGIIHVLLECKIQQGCRSGYADRVFQFSSAEAGRGAAFPVDRDRAVLQADRHIFQ